MDNRDCKLVDDGDVIAMEAKLHSILAAEVINMLHCTDLVMRGQRAAIVARLAEAYAALRGARKDAP